MLILFETLHLSFDIQIFIRRLYFWNFYIDTQNCIKYTHKFKNKAALKNKELNACHAIHNFNLVRAQR